MSGNSLRFVFVLAGLTLLVPMGGCVFVTDLISPDAFAALGFDPATIIPSQGRTLVSFTNGTPYEAAFSVVVSPDPLPGSTRAMVGALNVLSGNTRTLPYDCPDAGYISPGDLNDDFSLSTTAITVIAGDALVELTYTGAGLEAGRDYVCGDVIEMRLLQVGDGVTADDFAIQVRILPGR
jgi:hypothetical protein